jgi:hypothetical protein
MSIALNNRFFYFLLNNIIVQVKLPAIAKINTIDAKFMPENVSIGV